MRRALTPIDILRNCRGKTVSIELTSGETINGTIMRTDRAMNVVLKQCIRTGADGESFWRARESLVRGASIRNLRMDESVLKATYVPGGARRGGPRGAMGGRKREREGDNDTGGKGGDRPVRKFVKK